MQGFRADARLGGSGQGLPKHVSKSFRTLCQRPHLPPDITELAEEVCLACMPGFRAGGALGGPGQPSVNFTGSRQT
eukprot:1137210-Pelagomonas_calceolata.AAC.4